MLHMTVLGNRQPWNPDRFVVVCELCRPNLELGSWEPKCLSYNKIDFFSVKFTKYERVKNSFNYMHALFSWTFLPNQTKCLCVGGVSDALFRELWHACAGPLVIVPRQGELVYYFPQGHMEQVYLIVMYHNWGIKGFSAYCSYQYCNNIACAIY
jgi:hypothetical protein